jgi:hypothetical protein
MTDTQTPKTEQASTAPKDQSLNSNAKKSPKLSGIDEHKRMADKAQKALQDAQAELHGRQPTERESQKLKKLEKEVEERNKRLAAEERNIVKARQSQLVKDATDAAKAAQKSLQEQSAKAKEAAKLEEARIRDSATVTTTPDGTKKTEYGAVPAAGGDATNPNRVAINKGKTSGSGIRVAAENAAKVASRTIKSIAPLAAALHAIETPINIVEANRLLSKAEQNHHLSLPFLAKREYEILYATTQITEAATQGLDSRVMQQQLVDWGKKYNVPVQALTELQMTQTKMTQEQMEIAVYGAQIAALDVPASNGKDAIKTLAAEQRPTTPMQMASADTISSPLAIQSKSHAKEMATGIV